MINNSNSNVNANTNTNTNTNAAVAGGKLCNKWVSFWLCLLLGVVIDLIAILAKSNPYYA